MKKKPSQISVIAFITAVFLACGLALSQSYPYQDANLPVESRIDDFLTRMTLDEKIGQMTQGEMPSVSTIEVANYYLGSILSGGGSVPTDNSPKGWADLYDSYQDAALSTRLGIPIIYGIDAVHGHNNVRDAVIFPHNIGLGAANDPNLMERIGAVTAEEVAATGIDWTFGPCVAVARDERWGRTYESYAEDPRVHNNIVGAYIRGLQGADAKMQGEKIVACAKHFIGDGGTTGGQTGGNTECNDAILRAIHLPPYQRAIEAGVGTFMPSFSMLNGQGCTGYGWLLTDLLKNELGFDGFIVSDWDSIRWLPGDYRAQIKQSINAGIDMAMAPDRIDWQPFISNLTDLVNNSEVPMTRIDDAVRRILRIKFRAGLFEHPYTNRSLASSFGSPEHRAVAREAVRKSLVILKNSNDILPIAKNADIFVAGSSAASLRKQCGGWTIGWQGMPNEYATSGTNILQGIQNISTGNITFSEDGSGATGHSIAIVIVGEEPYAEGVGDKTDLHLSSTDINTINTVHNSGVPYVIVLVSGRPMIITDQIKDADAFVAAWLPGTEGQGVAEVLFGDYPFTGKLSFTWPRDMNQIPINIGDSNYDPLFSYGFGIVSPAQLNVNKCTVTAGKYNNDLILISGSLYNASSNVISDANEIKIDINSENMVNHLVQIFPRNSTTFKNGRFNCTISNKPLRTSFAYSTKTSRFSFTARNVDLSGLSCPLAVRIEIGDYIAETEVNEVIVNGKRPMPINLLMGIKNSMRVDKSKFTRDKKIGSITRFSVSGGFSVQDVNDSNLITNPLSVAVGSQTFMIPVNNFKNRKGNFTCSRVLLSGEEIAYAAFNFNKGTFTLTIKNTSFSADSGPKDFNITFAGFSETAQVLLP